jgi:predicted chitinase/predicted phosphodiesterase
MTHLSAEKRARFFPFLKQAMDEFEINTPLREAAFLAQVAHESGEFRFMEEIWGPTAAQKRYEPVTQKSKELGNTQPGDGKRFKGRGPIQVTGRSNYQTYGRLLNVDLIADPTQAATPEVGFRIAGLYWKRNGLNELADQQFFKRITKRINGGFNGLEERRRYYERAKSVLGATTRGGESDEGPAEDTGDDNQVQLLTRGSETSRNMFALLIGVDCYLPNRLPDGGFYPSLGGCVRDINHIEDFLKTRLGLSSEQILKLTASNKPDSKEPSEPREQWPTYENMVAAFKAITERASPGDQIYIHYSGHGGRSVTSFPELKGQNGLDESLVPTDIGDSEARYLRDVEMAHILKQMSDRDLVVTIVLDSCHSGGATRGFGGGKVRGITSIDTTARPGDSLVAPRADLIATWQAIPPGQTRSAQLGAGWVPELKGSVLLAACRANELANEFPFDGGESNGALTYWLLDSLKQLGPGMTFKMLHDRILAKVNARFKEQTPQLHGDDGRVVFDSKRIAVAPSIRVLDVDLQNNKIRLGAGQAHRIGRGMQFEIFAADAVDFSDDNDRLAVAEVTESQATESFATLSQITNNAGLVIGAQAVLADAGTIQFRSQVKLFKQADLPATINQDDSLAKLEPEIAKSSWLELVHDGEVDFQVVVNANEEYEVWDASGHTVPNLRPALSINDKDAPSTLAQRLIHLTKFRNVKLIDNGASNSSLARQVTVELLGEAVDTSGGISALDVGANAVVKITNNSPKVLNLTIFDLQPDWGITQVYPTDADAEILDPGQSKELPLQNVSLPEGSREGIDTMKVFATQSQTSFKWLELPVLDRPSTRSAMLTRAPQNSLETLMSAFTADDPPEQTRAFNLGGAVGVNWTTTQLDFKVRQPPPKTLRHVRDPHISLLQAALEEVFDKKNGQARAAGQPVSRASVSDPTFDAVTDYLIGAAQPPSAPPRGAERSAIDTAKYCAGLAAKMAGELWNVFRGDRENYDAYKAQLTAKFGDCDVNFKDTIVKYAEFVVKTGGKFPYRKYENLSDSVDETSMPAQATIGIVADWGTGQPEALEVLRQVKQANPHVVVHLGDIYYAGTEHEVENYFYQPWRSILQLDTSGIVSRTLPGNHDLYSGGDPFYKLIDKLGQKASYFCLRNADWQVIGLDTALNDRLGGPPTSLDPTEVTWLKDKIDNAGNRRTILLSHHQLFSANDQFDGRSYNDNLYQQLAPMLPKVDLWLWGHEHDLVVFEPFKGLTRGRCVGGSAFPVGKDEMPGIQKNADVRFNKEVLLSKGPAFYQHCYAMIRLDGRNATVSYCEDSSGGRVLYAETI